MSAMSELDLIRREEFDAFFLGIGFDPCPFCNGEGECQDEYEGETVRYACKDCEGTGEH